jgi:hypothetical protein
MYIFVASLGLFLIKEAQAYDLQCTVQHVEGTKYILGSPKRTYHLTYTSDTGHLTTIHIADMIQPSEANDYVKYTDGEKVMTYALTCERY